MALNQTVQIKPKTPARSTERCPTMGGLLSNPDKSGWKRIRVPLITRGTNVRLEPIRLNRHVYTPGEVYTLPPEICDEIQSSIDNFEASITRQITGNQLNKSVLAEIDAQGRFDREEQLSRSGVILTSQQLEHPGAAA